MVVLIERNNTYKSSVKKSSSVYLPILIQFDLIFFSTKYWFILLLGVIMIAVIISYFLYRRHKDIKDLNKIQLNILRILRFTGIFGVGILILSPFFKDLKRFTQKPVVLVAWDNSGSMIQSGDSLTEKTFITGIQDRLQEDLGNDYNLVEYAFGNETERMERLDFSSKRSDYSDLIKTIESNHINENIGALIIGGDGIYNRGIDPVVAGKNLNFPIYTIGFGDTTEVSDAAITVIRSNRNTFSGNSFPVEVDLLFTQLKGQNIRISIWKGEQELESRTVVPATSNFFFSEEFIMESGSAGIQEYTVKVQEMQNERNKVNNYSTFAIHVLEKKQKILILSDGPHPDIGAIKNTLDQQNVYDVSLFTEAPYPSNIGDFNLVIAHQFPSAQYSLSNLEQVTSSKRIPFLYIIGNKTFIAQFNTLQLGAQIRTTARSGEMAQGVWNSSFGLFKLTDDFLEILPQLPPLQVPFGEYELAPELSPLCYQSLLNIETTKPLVAVGNISGKKTGFIFGEGLWRWRLFDYAQNKNQHNFDEFVNQIVQYLALRENEDNFIIRQESVYSETDDVVIHAEVYNDNYEKVSNASVSIQVTNDEGDEFQFVFDPYSNEYILNAGNLPRGDYSFEALAEVGEEQFKESGRFKVIPLEMEQTNARANHNILYQLAFNSGGNFYLPGRIDELVDQVKEDSRINTKYYYQERITELIDLKWLFLVLLIVFSVEWFLRKFWGVM